MTLFSKVSRWGAVALLMGALAAPNSRAAAEPLRLGTVDMQKALQTVEAGRKAKSQLEREFNARKKQLEHDQVSLQKAGEEFKKQALVMSDEARMKKQSELQERAMKLQETMARAQQEIQQKEHDLTQPIIEQLKGVIADLAKKRGYTMVLEKSETTVLFSQDKDDLTAEVIQAFNSKGAGGPG